MFPIYSDTAAHKPLNYFFRCTHTENRQLVDCDKIFTEFEKWCIGIGSLTASLNLLLTFPKVDVEVNWLLLLQPQKTFQLGYSLSKSHILFLCGSQEANHLHSLLEPLVLLPKFLFIIKMEVFLQNNQMRYGERGSK